jgi:hypothetical protein
VHTWLPVVIARVFSVIQASSLRERYFTLVNRNEILEVALDDIKRIANSDATIEQRITLIQGIIKNTIDKEV